MGAAYQLPAVHSSSLSYSIDDTSCPILLSKAVSVKFRAWSCGLRRTTPAIFEQTVLNVVWESVPEEGGSVF